MKITIIILAVLLFISIALNIVASASKTILMDKIRDLRSRVKIYKESLNCNRPIYFARRGYGESHYWAVYRQTLTTTGIVKVFDTDDESYNHFGAVELTDKLNETLCYD